MAKIRNAGHGVYADGTLFVHPGEVVDVSDEQAKYLLSADTPGKFERVTVTAAPAATVAAEPLKRRGA